ncbi:hypothetical protein KSP40_PGU000902 [Platanthera guangdongensis]|uniref:Uncharacterized protein n=1 Tax=Platanthera guangdongensis TaxID=2320717 RepID=A0ABR2M3G4_9ASPA
MNEDKRFAEVVECKSASVDEHSTLEGSTRASRCGRSGNENVGFSNADIKLVDPPGYGEPTTVPGFPVNPPGSPVFGRFLYGAASFGAPVTFTPDGWKGRSRAGGREARLKTEGKQGYFSLLREKILQTPGQPFFFRTTGGIYSRYHGREYPETNEPLRFRAVFARLKFSISVISSSAPFFFDSISICISLDTQDSQLLWHLTSTLTPASVAYSPVSSLSLNY